jgi:hypothetical protein
MAQPGGRRIRHPVSAISMRDIWSSDKTCLAIPRGTRFAGRYQTAVAEGQVRMGIIWTGLTRPSKRPGVAGGSIELVDTVAGDPDGSAGVSGEVNTHFWRKLGYVAAASFLDIGKTAVTASGEALKFCDLVSVQPAYRHRDSFNLCLVFIIDHTDRTVNTAGTLTCTSGL